jgi:hypothetical protein
MIVEMNLSEPAVVFTASAFVKKHTLILTTRFEARRLRAPEVPAAFRRIVGTVSRHGCSLFDLNAAVQTAMACVAEHMLGRPTLIPS